MGYPTPCQDVRGLIRICGFVVRRPVARGVGSPYLREPVDCIRVRRELGLCGQDEQRGVRRLERGHVNLSVTASKRRRGGAQGR